MRGMFRSNSNDDQQEVRSEQARETSRQLREVEHGLQRLLTDPDQFGRCGRCGATIAAARLEILPSTAPTSRTLRGDEFHGILSLFGSGEIVRSSNDWLP